VLTELEEEAIKVRINLGWVSEDDEREEIEYLKGEYGKMNAKIVTKDG
jgi:hypothetical protein